MQTPGRFNVMEVNGATVILDFGHNPSAVAALVEAVERFPNRSRRVVFSADGDRPDDSILRQAALLGDAFDRVLLYEEPGRFRGRRRGRNLRPPAKGPRRRLAGQGDRRGPRRARGHRDRLSRASAPASSS